MFDEQYVGNKIKNSAKLLYSIAMTIDVICGSLLLILGIVVMINKLFVVGLISIFGAVLTFSLGILFAWITHTLIFGFGHLIELTEKNNNLLKLMALSDNE